MVCFMGGKRLNELIKATGKDEAFFKQLESDLYYKNSKLTFLLTGKVLDIKTDNLGLKFIKYPLVVITSVLEVIAYPVLKIMENMDMKIYDVLTSELALEVYKSDVSIDKYIKLAQSQNCYVSKIANSIKDDFIKETHYGKNLQEIFAADKQAMNLFNLRKIVDDYFPNKIQNLKELTSDKILEAVKNGASFNDIVLAKGKMKVSNFEKFIEDSKSFNRHSKKEELKKYAGKLTDDGKKLGYTKADITKKMNEIVAKGGVDRYQIHKDYDEAYNKKLLFFTAKLWSGVLESISSLPKGEMGGVIALAAVSFGAIGSILTIPFDLLTFWKIRADVETFKLLLSDKAMELYDKKETYKGLKKLKLSKEGLSKAIDDLYLKKTEFGQKALQMVGEQEAKFALNKFTLDEFKVLFAKDTEEAIKSGADINELSKVLEGDGIAAYKDFIENPNIYKSGITVAELDEAFHADSGHSIFYEILDDTTLHKAEDWHMQHHHDIDG